MSAKPSTESNGNANSALRRGGWLATVIIVVGASWTVLTGACTGIAALMTLGIALIFGTPLVLGGVAVWVAGRMLRGDPTNRGVRHDARVGVVVAALGAAAGTGVSIAYARLPPDEFSANLIFSTFSAAGAFGCILLLVVSVWMLRRRGRGRTDEGTGS